MSSPFVWHELLTSDRKSAVDFYTSLFGWEFADGAFVVKGERVGGVRETSLPPHWAPFVEVKDPDESAHAAGLAGGRIAGKPSSPPGIVVVDSHGVPTVVTSHHGTDLFAWHILESRDVPVSRAWMETIAGWTSPPDRGLWRDGTQVASLANATHDRWLGLVLVDDHRAVRERAVSLCARVERADVEASGHGAYDVMVDPQGAVFAVFQAA
jgi:predicted enzyme related to lactoylglutathione lyase